MKSSDNKRKQNSDRYYWLKEHGICTSCGSEDAVKGNVLCQACKDRKNGVSREKYKTKYVLLKEQGICIQCKKEKAIQGKARCIACQNRTNELAKRRYALKKEQ